MKQSLYRVRQFRRAISERPALDDLARAESVLTSELFELFTRMLPFEQAHAIRAMDGMSANGYDHPDVLTAALLHDVGKVKHPLRPWERALGVLAKRFLPEKFHRWSQGEAKGFNKGIVVAANHAAWGADLAGEAGASERAVWLIRNHDTDPAQIDEQDRLVLSVFQAVDSAS